MPSQNVFLGVDTDEVELYIDIKTLQRHVIALGSSGSGKTVFCKILVEEFVKNNVPAICIDPQGDLCSLLLGTNESTAAQEYYEKSDVVIFTPASKKGIQLCVDPLQVDLSDYTDDYERISAISRISTMVVSLLGYKLDTPDALGVRSIIDKTLQDLDKKQQFPRNLKEFTSYFSNLDDDSLKSYEMLLNLSKIKEAKQRLARLDVGERALLFNAGHSINIEQLLGLGEFSVENKTRVAVIYLNTLQTQEDKDFFVATLVEQLYLWMLKKASQELNLLFFIDEVHSFIPPVKKPSCKEGLARLFEQSRKYGICCAVATQSPGGIDYKAMGQFNTWAVGRLITEQDRKKVKPNIEALAGEHLDFIMSQIPSLKPGEFILISPDNFSKPKQFNTRRLYSKHEKFDEHKIHSYYELWNQSFPVYEENHYITEHVAGNNIPKHTSSVKNYFENPSSPQKQKKCYLCNALSYFKKYIGLSYEPRPRRIGVFSNSPVDAQIQFGMLDKEMFNRNRYTSLAEIHSVPNDNSYNKLKSLTVNNWLKGKKTTDIESITNVIFKLHFRLKHKWMFFLNYYEYFKCNFFGNPIEESNTIFLESFDIANYDAYIIFISHQNKQDDGYSKAWDFLYETIKFLRTRNIQNEKIAIVLGNLNLSPKIWRNKEDPIQVFQDVFFDKLDLINPNGSEAIKYFVASSVGDSLENSAVGRRVGNYKWSGDKKNWRPYQTWLNDEIWCNNDFMPYGLFLCLNWLSDKESFREFFYDKK